MAAFVVTVVALGVLALLSGLVAFTYLCAMSTGRVFGWVFQVEPDDSACELDVLLSPEHLAEINALVASSQRMASAGHPHADAFIARRCAHSHVP